MRFFFSGEIDINVADSFREVRNNVNSTLNNKLGYKEYGSPIEKIAIIPILRGPKFTSEWKERRLIQYKSKTADYRLVIDYDAWMSGDYEVRRKLLIDNVLDAIDDINRKLKGSFKGEELRNDILSIYDFGKNDR